MEENKLYIYFTTSRSCKAITLSDEILLEVANELSRHGVNDSNIGNYNWNVDFPETLRNRLGRLTCVTIINFLNMTRIRDVICSNTTPVSGTTVNLEVVVTGDLTDIKYTWKCGNKVIGNTKLIVIDDIQPNESGVYNVTIKTRSQRELISGDRMIWVMPEENLDLGMINISLSYWIYKFNIIDEEYRPLYYINEHNEFIFHEIHIKIIIPLVKRDDVLVYMKEIDVTNDTKSICHVFSHDNSDKIVECIIVKTMFIRGLAKSFLSSVNIIKYDKLKLYCNKHKIEIGSEYQYSTLVDKIVDYLGNKKGINLEDLSDLPLPNISNRENTYTPGSHGIYVRTFGPKTPIISKLNTELINTTPVNEMPVISSQQGTANVITDSINQSISPPLSLHRVALNNIIYSGCISLVIESIQSILLYKSGEITGKEAIKRITKTTGTGLSLASVFTYGTYYARELIAIDPNAPLSKALLSCLKAPNIVAGGIVVAVSLCIDITRCFWYREITKTQLLENLGRSAITQSAGIVATTGIAMLIGTTLAASWTGIGVIIVSGVLASWEICHVYDLIINLLQEAKLKNEMRTKSTAILGLSNEENSRDIITDRFHKISMYIHPDRARYSDGSDGELFIQLNEAKEFLLRDDVNIAPTIKYLKNTSK